MIEQVQNIQETIEGRIPELIEAHVLGRGAREGGAALPTPPHDAIMEAVANQALVSSRGGKRLRARLMLAFAGAFGAGRGVRCGTEQAALDIACAIEVFQTAALVHDDIIDDSDTRRGKPAAHRSLAADFHRADASPRHLPQSPASSTRDDSVGAGLGIMLGDLLATVSVQIANGAESDPDLARDVMAAFLNMQREVEIGQVLDLAAEAIDLDDPRRLAANALDVFRWKTASYTTIAPIELGLLHAGAGRADSRSMAERIGAPLGLAFQLADDMLDVAGDTARTGKPTGGDIREGKRTALLADALLATAGDDHAYLLDAYRRPARDEADVARITAIFEESGALDASRRRIAGLWDESSRALEDACDVLRVDHDGRRSLRAACGAFVPETIRTRA